MGSNRLRMWVVGFAVLAAGVLGGCNFGAFGGSGTVFDTSGNRVWTGDGDRCGVRAHVSWDFVRGHTEVEWVLPDGGSVDARAAVRRCEAAEKSPDAVVTLEQEADGSAYHRYYRYADTRTIVCIEPLVVIVTPIPHTELTDRAEAWDAGELAISKIGSGVVTLDKGYEFGVKLQAAPDAWWHAPDLGISRTELTSDADGVLMIELPTARLLLQADGDHWQVGCQRRSTAGSQ